MDRLGLQAGRLGQPFGRAPGRGAQQATHLLGAQDEQDGVDQRRFANARPTGNNERAARQGLLQRLPLTGRQLLTGLLLAPRHGLLQLNRRVAGGRGAQLPDALGDAFFRPLERGQENQFLPANALQNQLLPRQRALQGRRDDLLLHPE